MSATSSFGTPGYSPAYSLHGGSLKPLFLQCFPKMVLTKVCRESKVVSISEDQKPLLWKSALGLRFPNSLYVVRCVHDALYCWQNKQCWEGKFWRASHIPSSLTIPNGNHPASVFFLILLEKKRSLHLATFHKKPYGSGWKHSKVTGFFYPHLNEILLCTWALLPSKITF